MQAVVTRSVFEDLLVKNFPSVKVMVNRNVVLHTLITHRVKAAIAAWIIQHTRDGTLPKLINYKAMLYRLTPLHVCAMLGDADTACLLIQNGADPTLRDYAGNTACHLAAMNADKEFRKRVSVAAQKEYPDLLSLLNYKLVSPNLVEDSLFIPDFLPGTVICHAKKGNEPLKPLTKEDFKAITGKSYSHYQLATSEMICKRWCGIDIEMISFFVKRLRPHYVDIWSQYSKNAPKLYLDHIGGSYCELRTAEPIPKGRGVTNVGGELGSSDPKNSDYGNEGCYALQDFPNCLEIFFPINGLDQPFLIANEDIPEGALVTTGRNVHHACKWTKGQIREKKRLLDFIKNLDFDKTIKKSNALYATILLKEAQWPSPEDYLEMQFTRNKLCHIFSTPFVLATLLLERHEKVQEIITLLATPEKDLDHLMAWDATNLQVLCFKNYILRLDELILCIDDGNDQKLGNEIIAFFKECFNRYSVITVLQTIRELATCMECPNIVKSRKNWEQYRQAIDTHMAVFEHLLFLARDLVTPRYAEAKDSIERIIAMSKALQTRSFANAYAEACHFSINTEAAVLLDALLGSQALRF